jgi:phage terminase Nu1 subunit (DNA packaging protein)
VWIGVLFVVFIGERKRAVSNIITLADGGVLDLAVWPLPEGVEDGILNRGQLARACNVSENTITKWVTQGMPVLSDGQNGVAYEFQLSHCYAWRQDRDGKARALKARGDQLAVQAALVFRNLDADQEEAEGSLTADDLRKWSEAEYHRNRVAEQRGDLVRADGVRRVIEGLLVAVGNAFDTLPDWAEVNLALSAEQVSQLQLRCDLARDELRAVVQADLLAPGRVIPLGARQEEMAL